MSHVMSIGVWEPDKKPADTDKSVDEALLRQFLDFSVSEDLSEKLSETSLKNAGLGDHSWVMGLEAGAWDVAQPMANAEIDQLIRLFTRLESLPGWDADKRSPVIPLVRLLRDRQAFEPALRKWIKANTDNRFLPYGSAL